MILDEYHLHETTEYYDWHLGMKTRANPLFPSSQLQVLS